MLRNKLKGATNDRLAVLERIACVQEEAAEAGHERPVGYLLRAPVESGLQIKQERNCSIDESFRMRVCNGYAYYLRYIVKPLRYTCIIH